MRLNKVTLVIIILLISASGFSQVDEKTKENIEIKSYHIDNDLGCQKLKKRFKVDSIKIKSVRYENKISSDIWLNENAETIQLDIYLENENFVMIKATERSANFKSYENANQITILYFENGMQIDEKIRTGIPKGLHGIGIPKDFDSDKTYGYEVDFTPELIIKLSNSIIEQTAE